MKKMKKLLALTLTVLIAVSCLAACGSEEKPTSNSPESADGKLSGEITVWSWNAAADALTEIAELYMEKNPGTLIHVEYVDSDYEKLRPVLTSGIGVPDVFTTQQRDFPAFMHTYGDIFADVTDILQPESENFVEVCLKQAEKNGNFYAFPWDAGPCGLYYHIPTFEAAGVKVENIKTWEDFMDAARTIKEKTGKYILSTDFNGSAGIDLAMLMLNQQSGQVYDADGKVNLASDEMLKTYELILKMQEDDIIQNNPSGWNERIQWLNEGKLCGVATAVWYAGTMVNSVGDRSGEWGLAPLPGFGEEQYMAASGGSVVTIYKNSSNVELARDFVRFVCMDPEAAKINIEYGLFSAYKPSYSLPEYSEVSEYFGVPIGDTFAQWTDAPAFNFGEFYTEIEPEIMIAQGEILLKGKEPVEALQEATARAQRMIDAKS